MEVNFEVKEKDWINFNLWSDFSFGRNKLKYIILFIYLLFISRLAIIAIRDYNFMVLLMKCGPHLILIALYFLVSIISIKLKSKKLKKTNDFFEKKSKLKISKKYFELLVEDSKTKIEWKTLYNIVLKKRYCYILTSISSGIIIPLDEIEKKEELINNLNTVKKQYLKKN